MDNEIMKELEIFAKRRWKSRNRCELRLLYADLNVFKLTHQCSDFDWLLHTLIVDVGIDIINNAPCEDDVTKYFLLNLKTFIPDGMLMKPVSDARNIPDFYVSIGGIMCVGEVKLDKFTKKSKRQLRRYMEHYKTKHGYAVACDLTTSLDSDMSFIKIDMGEVERMMNDINVKESGGKSGYNYKWNVAGTMEVIG